MCVAHISSPALSNAPVLLPPPPSVSQPLLRLPRVSTFVVNCKLEPYQLAVVKQLSSLTSLSVNDGRWTLVDLRALLLDGSPHQLHKLQHLDLDHTQVTSTQMTALLTLPSLTEMRPYAMGDAVFHYVAAFPQLRILRIMPPLAFNPLSVQRATDLLASLSQLGGLRRLELEWSDAAAGCEGFGTLLNGLAAAAPLLQELSVEHCSISSPSLVRLSALQHLRSFALVYCTFVDDAPFDNLLSLLSSFKKLDSLSLANCTPLLSEEQCVQLTPPSAFLPSLTHFGYKPY